MSLKRWGQPTLSELPSDAPGPPPIFTGSNRARWAFRKPPQLIVMSVTAVTLPLAMRFHCDAPQRACASPSLHRHDERHGEISLGMRYSHPHDGDDAHEGPLRGFSKCRDRAPRSSLLSREHGDTVHPKVVVTGNFANRDNRRKQPRGES
jgi:hypothetical protein